MTKSTSPANKMEVSKQDNTTDGLNNITSAFGFFALTQLITGLCYVSYYSYHRSLFESLFNETGMNIFAVVNGILLLINGVSNAATAYQNKRAKAIFVFSLVLSIIVLVCNVFMAYKLKNMLKSANEKCVLQEALHAHIDYCKIWNQKIKYLLWGAAAGLLNAFSTKICSCFGIAMMQQKSMVEEEQKTRELEMV
eukprot:TCONS_00046164-protein